VALIDQRILIDAPTDIVWQVIADSSRLAEWHTGYKKVSVLTVQSAKVGSRRRCTTKAGKDIIEEITAWVEGMGYEYTIISGSPYRKLQGRVRLQAGPDGTSVQWTIYYKPKGILGRVRSQFGGRRQMEELVANSLRQLRRAVDAQGKRMDEIERAKVAIRGRLNAEERATYQRRHPPPEPVVEPTEDAPVTLPAVDMPAVPSFVADLEQVIEEETSAADTQPKPPAGLREAVAAQSEEPTPVPPEHRPFTRPTQTQEIPVVPIDPESHTPPHGIPLPPPEPPAPKTPPRAMPAVELNAPPPNLPPPTPKTDTGEVSIWEVFGLRRPSEADQDALDDLIKTVEVRKRKTGEHSLYRGFQRGVPVRRLPQALGLRVRLALAAVRVRLHQK